MSAIPATTVIMPKPAPTYNGVKIRVNNPSVNINNDERNKGNYNAVDIVVNNPKVNNITRPIYNYPQANGIVTFDQTGRVPVKIPSIPVTPVAYTTINNRTLINAEFGPDTKKSVNKEPDKTSVPAPNITTIDAEKNPTFNGLDKVEIVPPSNAKPEVDINAVIAKLSDKNYDVQAIQLEQIARTAIENPVQAVPYIVTDIYSSLIDIMKADTTNLAKPTEEQVETRKKIIINELVKERAMAQGQNIDTIELPYKLTKEEAINAAKLSPFEQAERNKEYAMLTTALLTKVYIDENKQETGTVPSLTDLPGIATFVDILRYNKNVDLKMTAIDSLMYIRRPEYNNEIKAILELAAKDSNQFVAQRAVAAIGKLEK